MKSTKRKGRLGEEKLEVLENYDNLRRVMVSSAVSETFRERCRLMQLMFLLSFPLTPAHLSRWTFEVEIWAKCPEFLLCL